jgi:heme-degrading monooxygenase HmoA
MHARIIRASGWASEEEGRQFIKERVIPGLKDLAGFAGGYWMYDRGSGRMLAVTLWETEQHVRASDAAAGQIREEAKERISAKFDPIEYYEVIAQETRAGTPSR